MDQGICLFGSSIDQVKREDFQRAHTKRRATGDLWTWLLVVCFLFFYFYTPRLIYVVRVCSGSETTGVLAGDKNNLIPFEMLEYLVFNQSCIQCVFQRLGKGVLHTHPESTMPV